jgi:hypothetical protein
MATMRQCALCGETIKQNVAAHDCPHGQPCRYLANADGMPADWSRPACSDCRGAASVLTAVPAFSLTRKAFDDLD